MSPESIVAALPIAIAVVAFVDWKMNRIVQPMRVEMVSKADAFLARPGIPEPFRAIVEDDIRTVFGMRGRLLLGFVLVPFVAFIFLARQRYLRDWKRDYESLTLEDRADLRDLCELHDRITFVNHLILFPVFLAYVTIFMMTAVILRALLKGTLDRPGTAEIVRGVLEHKPFQPFRPTTGYA